MNHRTMARATALPALALLLVSQAAQAQKSTKAAGQPRVDKPFMMKAAQGGLAALSADGHVYSETGHGAIRQIGQPVHVHGARQIAPHISQ